MARKKETRATRPPRRVTSRAPTADDIEVGRRLRLLRIKHKISQSAIAEAVGLTFQQVQKYEKGTNSLKVSRITQLARVFDVHPNEITGWGSQHSAAPMFDAGEVRLLELFKTIDPDILKTLLRLLDLLSGTRVPTQAAKN